MYRGYWGPAPRRLTYRLSRTLGFHPFASAQLTCACLSCSPSLYQDDAAKKGYQAWLQSARVADAMAEVEVLKAEAAGLLDKHLTKTAEEVRPVGVNFAPSILPYVGMDAV